MYVDRFNPDGLYITFDNGHSKFRDELNPHYKGHRKNISIDYESLQKQKAEIMKILRYLRINYIFDKHKLYNYEGDDFLAYLVLKEFNKDKVTIVSSDKDFNQLISKSVKIFNPRKEQYIREDNCKDLFDYSPEETVDYLSLVGDKSDDIEGYPGMGPKKTRAFLDKYGSIKSYLSNNPDEKMKAIYEKNKKLIDLRWYINNIPLKKVPMKIYKDKSLNLNKFRDICITYSLASFMTNNFIKVFESLNSK